MPFLSCAGLGREIVDGRLVRTDRRQAFPVEKRRRDAKNKDGKRLGSGSVGSSGSIGNVKKGFLR